MRKSLTATIIIAFAALSACHVHAGDGGTKVSRNYQVGNFHEIEVAGPFDVEVRTGANPSVSAQGSEKLLERTVVEVEGDKLVIRPENNNGLFHFGWSNHGHAHFVVTVQSLNGAAMAGSGRIAIDRVQGQRFEGNIAGSGDLDVAALDVQQLKLSIAGSGGVKAGTGKSQSADYEIAGSGSLDASGIQAQQVKVSIAGSGGVRAHALVQADVDIMGSGDVKITGGGKCNVSKMGSGSVNCS